MPKLLDKIANIEIQSLTVKTVIAELNKPWTEKIAELNNRLESNQSEVVSTQMHTTLAQAKQRTLKLLGQECKSLIELPAQSQLKVINNLEKKLIFLQEETGTEAQEKIAVSLQNIDVAKKMLENIFTQTTAITDTIKQESAKIDNLLLPHMVEKTSLEIDKLNRRLTLFNSKATTEQHSTFAPLLERVKTLSLSTKKLSSEKSEPSSEAESTTDSPPHSQSSASIEKPSF